MTNSAMLAQRSYFAALGCLGLNDLEHNIMPGAKGAAVKAAKWIEVGDHALALANVKNYPSRNNADLNIKIDVMKFARTKGLTMSDNQARRTIDDWLKDRGYNRLLPGGACLLANVPRQLGRSLFLI
jgi:hypothetical protein